MKLVDKLSDKLASVPDKTMRRKMARQAARSVLPNSTETKIFVTSNARALRNFIELRANEAADIEIRKVAVKILRIMQAEAPNLFGDYEIYHLPDGTEAARTQFRKV
jgi:thymidylate synthase (FAD)